MFVSLLNSKRDLGGKIQSRGNQALNRSYLRSNRSPTTASARPSNTQVPKPWYGSFMPRTAIQTRWPILSRTPATARTMPMVCRVLNANRSPLSAAFVVVNRASLPAQALAVVRSSASALFSSPALAFPESPCQARRRPHGAFRYPQKSHI